MLVAAAGGVGFGLGMTAGSDDSTIDPGEAAPATEPPIDVVADTIADIDDEAEPQIETDIETEEPDFDELAASEPVTASDVASSGSEGWTVFGNEPSELLVERVTEAGITLRAHLGQLWNTGEYHGEDFGGPDGWQPPGWCFESGQVRIAMGGAATGTPVIDVGSVSWWNEPYNGRSVSPLVMGNADHNPHRVVFVHRLRDRVITNDPALPGNG